MSDLGDGWGPVILNSQTELIFIKEIHKELNASINYWIGGSTDVENEDSLTFLDYLPFFSGMKMVLLHCKFIVTRIYSYLCVFVNAEMRIHPCI